MSLDEDVPSTDDEKERSEKRVKLTDATQALGEQITALQVNFLFLKFSCHSCGHTSTGCNAV